MVLNVTDDRKKDVTEQYQICCLQIISLYYGKSPKFEYFIKTIIFPK